MTGSSDDGFDLFWSAYPKKRAKGDARKAWGQTAAIRPALDEVLSVLEQAKRSPDWHKADSGGIVGAFIPYPATWLRAEGWADEYQVKLPGVGARMPEARVDIPPPPTEEQRARARELMQQAGLRRVA